MFRALPRRDVKPLAKTLLAKFGSFAEVIAAPEARLAEVKGLGGAGITELKIVQGFADREQFRVLFLDKRNALIADEVQQTGTVDHTPVYPREVVKRALELSASAVVLVHNHPSGDPTPSHADIQMTKAIMEVAGPLGISIHDHLIVGKDGHASLKGLQLI